MPNAAVALLYALAALLACAPALHSGFAGDDFIWLYDASQCHALGDLFAVHDVAFAHYDGVRLNPTTNAFFAIGWPLFGLNAVGWHLFTMLLYVLTALLLREWLKHVGVRPWAALAAGLGFVLYPLHAQPVEWLSAIGEVLVGLCTMGALVAWVKWRGDGRLVWLGLSMLSLVAGALAKESGLLIGPLVVMADLLLVPRGARRGWLLLPCALTVLGGMWKAAVISAYREHIAEVTWLTASDGAIGTFRYLALALLGVDRAASLGRSAAAAWAAVAACALVIATLVARGARRPAFHLCWTLLAVQPYVWWVPSQTLFPRYAWQASLPLLCLAALGVSAIDARIVRRQARLALQAAVVVALLWCGRCLNETVKAECIPDQSGWLPQSISRSVNGLTPADPVWVYNPLTTENAAGRAVVLFGGVDPGQVHDWYDALHASSVGPDDRFVHFDVGAQTFADVSKEVRAAHADLAGRLPETRSARDQIICPMAGLDGWTPAGVALDGAVLRTPGGSASLRSPPLEVSPWAVYGFEVRYVPLAGPVQMRLCWTSDAKPDGGPELEVGAVMQQDGGQLVARFIPANRTPWWTGGRIRYVRLIPASSEATLRIDDIRLYTFGSLH